MKTKILIVLAALCIGAGTQINTNQQVTFIGHRALEDETLTQINERCVAIGRDALASGTQAIAIGNYATCTNNNHIVIRFEDGTKWEASFPNKKIDLRGMFDWKKQP